MFTKLPVKLIEIFFILGKVYVMNIYKLDWMNKVYKR